MSIDEWEETERKCGISAIFCNPNRSEEDKQEILETMIYKSQAVLEEPEHGRKRRMHQDV